MKTIKDAVIALNGKLPDENEKGCFRALCAAIYYVEGDNGIRLGSFEEFEACAKRLGYINGYRWDMEYPTNGKQPDLGGDVVIEPFYDDKWHHGMKCGTLDWRFDSDECDPVTSFRITDPRYKPADTSYLNTASVVRGDPSIRDELNLSKSLTHREEGLTHNWHERGELPPVGVEFELKPYWHRVKVVAHDNGNIVYWDYRDQKYDFGNFPHYFRPIRTEREKVIEAAVTICAAMKPNIVERMASLYDAGMLVLPPKKSDTED